MNPRLTHIAARALGAHMYHTDRFCINVIKPYPIHNFFS